MLLPHRISCSVRFAIRRRGSDAIMVETLHVKGIPNTHTRAWQNTYIRVFKRHNKQMKTSARLANRVADSEKPKE